MVADSFITLNWVVILADGFTTFIQVEMVADRFISCFLSSKGS